MTHKRMISAICLCFGLVALTGCFVKPKPITEAEHWERARADADSLFDTHAAPSAPISLAEAIARAMKHNLDHRLALMEAAFSQDQIAVANLNMLPRLAANAGYSNRDSEAASRSISLKGRNESLEPSVSSQPERFVADLSFSWSMLDFGLSYFQARQQADKFLILQERRRRILNNLIKDVITEYFRVSVAEAIGDEVAETLMQAEQALAVYQRIEENRSAPLATTLEQQRALVNIISHLRLISMQLAAARSRLAALMNLPLTAQFTVVELHRSEVRPPVLTADLPTLESVGLYLRPDLREEAYQARIEGYEVKKEVLRMVPGLSAFSSINYDSNKYLANTMWSEAGLRATLDIIGLAGKYKSYKSSKTQLEVGRLRRLASSLAALVQINMSYFQYRQAVEIYNDAEKLSVIENKLLDISRAAAQAREAGELDRIRQSAMSLNAQLERNRSLIEVLAAWGNLYFSVGGDLAIGVTGEEELHQLTLVVEACLHNWLSGGLPPLPAEAPMRLLDGRMAAVASDASYASIPVPVSEATPLETAPVFADESPAIPALAPGDFGEPEIASERLSSPVSFRSRRPARVMTGKF